MSTAVPEAKAKIRRRQQAGINAYLLWLRRQPQRPTLEQKVEMFDFFIDQAMKRK